MTNGTRIVLLVFALVAFLGPNGLYLYHAINNPALNMQALNNPISLAFIIEAMMLLFLFLWYVFHKTKSCRQVLIYLVLSFLGSLAFSFPLFLYLQNKNQTK